MKKLISILLCILLVLSFCGCKNGKPNQSSYSADGSASTEQISSENDNQENLTSSKDEAATSTSSKSPGVVTYEVPDDIPTIDKENYFYGSIIARISSDKVKALQPGMTYRMIFDALGKSSSAGHLTGYYEYVVDNDNLLMFYYENLDDVCNMSGEELLKTLIPLNSHENKPLLCTVYAVIVKKYDKSLIVSSPNYKLFDCANISFPDAKITFANGKKATKDDIKQGQSIVIKHEAVIFESDPPQINAKRIIIQ